MAVKKSSRDKAIESKDNFEQIMIPIRVGKAQYYIGSDRHNFILGTRQADKKTKVRSWSAATCSYHPTLESLFLALYKMKLKTVEVKTLEELHRAMNKTNDEIMGLYGEITLEEGK